MNCAQRAADNNKNIFSLQKGSIGDDQCYIWDSLPSDKTLTGVENLTKWNDGTLSTVSGGTPLLVMLKSGMFQIWFVGTSLVKKALKVRELSSQSHMTTAGFLDNWRAAYIDLMTELNKISPTFSVFNFIELLGTGDIVSGITAWDEWCKKINKDLDWWTCDATYGGGINSLAATWGANCGEKHGNYTSMLSADADGRAKITSHIEKINTWVKKKKPKVHFSVFHPGRTVKEVAKLAAWEAECGVAAGLVSRAPACGSWKGAVPCSGTAKNFSISYKCGLIDSEVFQKTATERALVGDAIKLDCQDSFDMCGTFGLKLTDTGSVEIVNNNTNTPITLFDQQEDNWQTKAITNLIWEKNTIGSSLLAGQVLLGGEFLTDSNNMFQLLLQPTGVLELNMAVNACIPLTDDCSGDDCPQYYHPDPTLTNPRTSAYYTFDKPNNNNLHIRQHLLQIMQN